MKLDPVKLLCWLLGSLRAFGNFREPKSMSTTAASVRPQRVALQTA